MNWIDRKNIDTQKWDEQVSNSPIENIFLYSWYLDAVAESWGAIVTSGYQTILPVPYTSKLGVRQFIQAPFTREYDIIGNQFSWKDAMNIISEKFKSIHFRSRESGILAFEKQRRNQEIDLTQDFQSCYSTNARRILKKTGAFVLEQGNSPEVLLTLFRENVAHKIESVSNSDLKALQNLMQVSLEKKKGELFCVKDGEEIVAAGFFLLDKKRITYLKGASTDQAKKSGAMYFLLDQAMNQFKLKYHTFDFGGSDVANVAGFYHKFGAKDRTYFDYCWSDLPRWFKAIKKIKA